MNKQNDVVTLWMKFCEVNNTWYVGWSHGAYTFVDQKGMTWYYLTEKELRELFN